MAQKGRPGLSADQKSEVWHRWRSGESLSDIGRAIDKHPASVFGVLRLHGGITPAARTRAPRHLSLAEREEISRGLAGGCSIRDIAHTLKRSPSTISREVARHGGVGRYRAITADQRAWESARRPKDCCLASNKRLRQMVATKLSLKWSPEQIAGWLKTEYPDNDAMHVSHETIYQSLYIQARGVLKKELVCHLRSGRVFRQSRHQNLKDWREDVLLMLFRLVSGHQKLKTEQSPAIGKAT